MRWCLLFLSMMIGGGCAEAPQNQTVTVCSGTVCVEQDPSVATYDPATALNDPDPAANARITELETLAQDNPSAAYDLGLRYFRGDGVRQDSYRALQWMRSAGEQGDRAAQAAVGRLYFTGLDEMGSDLREAERWLSMAAAQGDAESAALLPEVQAALREERAEDERLQKWRYETRYYWARGWPYRWYWHPVRRYYCSYPC